MFKRSSYLYIGKTIFIILLLFSEKLNCVPKISEKLNYVVYFC